MIKCPYCGSELEYRDTKVVNQTAHKFYNLYVCTNESCVTNNETITDCTGILELGHVNCCYPEELIGLNG
jgi:hypothetical protein